MKTILVGINAKYIHPNMAIRLLKANTNYDCDIIEFNIKDSIDNIFSAIEKYDIIALSCYIWNIEIVKKLLVMLSNKIVILGGPEVSYNAKYYLENKLCNYVIKNEGEESFDMLLSYLIDKKISLDDIPNLYYEDKYTFDKYVDISKIKTGYYLLNDLKNQITYIETSRGCPYKCGYCMASLDNKVRFFDIENVKKDILELINRGARIIKFLDRTFNANKKFLDLIDFIIENHKNNSFQFEITGDLLDPSIIKYINEKAPKNLFRFEIGIQSTNINANKAVYRIQDNEKLFNNIRLIQDAGIIDLHLDLIAGLPYENYESFIKTFNDVLSLRPKELQLGFLKLLYGTKLHEEKEMYNYVYKQNAPYEIIENKFMSIKDIENIHITEDAFEKYYNSDYYKKSINLALDNIDNHYMFFYDLGLKYKEFKPKKLEDSFKLLDEFIKGKDINYKAIHKSLLLEYLNYFNVKPTIWCDEQVNRKSRNEILRNIFEKNNLDIKLDDLYKYSVIIELDDSYILAIYKEKYKKILDIKKG